MAGLAVRICATPKRARWAEYLAQMTGAQVCWDTTNDLWSGAKYCLESYEPGDTHMLFMQDDILPCRDLVATAEKLIELRPNNPISLFSNRQQIAQCKLQGLHWLKLGKWLMAQAYIVPIEIVNHFIWYADKYIDPSIYYDDNRWAMYCFYNNIDVFATAPSLVEHLGWNSTTHGHYQLGQEFEPRLRMAKWYIGFENSGLDINWANLDFVNDPECGNNSDFCNYLLKP